jgi:hypothetical protein
MQRDEMRRAAQPPPPGGWSAGSTSPSSPQGLETRSRKRARTHSASSPPADSNGTLGAAEDAQRDISRVTTDSYQGNTASAYRTWLQSIDQQTTGKPAFTSYIGAKVAQHFETGWGVGVFRPALRNRLGCRCCITADPRLRSMTRTPAPDALRPTKSQPFSIFWEDNTDSVVDLRTLLQNVRNYEQGLHRPSTSILPPTSNGARAHSTVVSNGAAAPSPSSALPPPQAHATQAPAAAAASARAAPGAGIFDGMPSIPGDLVDLLTRNGTFAFLEDLHETGRLWDLRNFRIPRLVPRGAASKDFGDGLKAILALAERYPAQSLSLYILRAFAQFLPALLMPCSRRGKPRHVSLNARRFQKGEWESLWTQTLKHNNRELAHRAKQLDGNPPAPASIRARARYAEYCARKGALSKANQAITSDLTPSAAPTNINELRAKNPEPTHPARDPTTQPASLIWPQTADTGAWWEEEEGQEYIQKHFSVKHIAKYFRTRSPVSAAGIDGWRGRELMAPLFMGDDEELQAPIRDHLILPYLFGDFHPSHIQEYAGAF